jgi:hypothetical protein
MHVSRIDGELSKGVDWSNYPVYYPKNKQDVLLSFEFIFSNNFD